MKKIFSVFMLVNCFCLGVSAQTMVQITTGTAGTPAYNAGPIYRSSAGSAYDASRYSYLYTPDELAAVGINNGDMISELGWMKNNATLTNGGGIFRIYLKNSSQTTYGNASETWANLNSGATMAYENLSQTIPATQNPTYIMFTLSAPFIYTGGSLEISTEWDINQVAGNPTTGTFDWMWSTVTDRIYGTGQTSLANAGTLSATTNSISAIDNRRPFLQIGYTPGVACSGVPNGGTANASQASVCPGNSVSISVTGASIGTGLSFQWQSSPDGFAWTDVSGATGPTYSPVISAALNFRRRIICNAGPDTGYSTVVAIQVTPFLNCYCTSNATSTIDEDIQNVTFAGINNTSPTNCQTYTDYTSIVGMALKGLSYPLSVNTNDCENVNFYNRRVAVFIDWNQNGSFAEPDELVFYPTYLPPAATQLFTGSVTVPLTAASGITRMRVICVETTGAITACGTYTWGETEDYYLNVLPPPADEAGVLAITKPEIAACSLGNELWVNMQNLGANDLTQTNFVVKVNGITVPVSNPWTGNVPAQSIAEVQVPISYTLADGDSVSIEVSMPNGLAEDSLLDFNNLTTRVIWAGLAGVKTIDAAGSGSNNYLTMDAAIDAVEVRGVCDTVYFRIATGNYNSQHIFGQYPGSGAGRLAVFESASGNAADVVFADSNTTAADNYLFRFNGGDGYMLRNLTGIADGAAFSTVVDIRNGSDDLIFEGNAFIGDTAAAYNASDFDRVVVSSAQGTNDHRTVLRNNLIQGGNRALNLGGLATSYEEGVVLENNSIEKYAYIGVILGQTAGYTVQGNTFRPRTDLTQDVFGVYVSVGIEGAAIDANDIQSDRTGASIFLNNAKGVRVSNNFLYQGDTNATGLARCILVQDVNSSNVLMSSNSMATYNDNLTSAAVSILDGSQMRVLNNNIGAFGMAPALRVEKSYSLSAADYNNLFGDNLANILGSVHTTLANLQAATSMNTNSMSVNPGFNGTDLHTCAPELNGTAMAMAEITADFDGNARTATPDIGADEFVGDAVGLLTEDDFLKCPADAVTLGNAPIEGVTYAWTPSGSTSEITVTNAGTYVVTVTSACGSFSDTAVVANKPLPDANFAATNVGLAAIFDNNSTNGNSYLWDFGDGNTSAENSPSHVFTAGGTYSVTLTVTNDCGTDVFGPVPVNVIAAGIDEVEGNLSVNLFPNPTNGQFTVSMSGLANEATVLSVIDVTGKVMLSHNVPAGTNQVSLDATAFASGVYSVKISNGELHKVIRLLRK